MVFTYRNVSLLLIFMAVYQAAYTYSDYLTSFCEQLLPHYRCHTVLKNIQSRHIKLLKGKKKNTYLMTIPKV